MDSKYATLTARVKGGDGIRIYKRNRMIMTNPIATGKDPTFDTITYEWAPPGVTQKLVRIGSSYPVKPELCHGFLKLNDEVEMASFSSAPVSGNDTKTVWASVFLIHRMERGLHINS